MRRLAPCLLALGLLCAAAPAAGGDLNGRKQSVDSRLTSLQDKLSQERAREQALGSELADVNGRIRALEGQVGGVSNRLTALEDDLALHERKLERLKELFQLQTRRFRHLQRQYHLAVERLGARIREAYESGQPDTLDVLLSSSSLTDLVDQFDFVNQVGRQDGHIADAVDEAKGEVRVARERTRKVKVVVAAETQTIAVRTAQVRAVRDQLLASQHSLVLARSTKRVSLASLKESERADASEIDALQADSASLGAQIAASQAVASSSSTSTHVSSSGLIWPVSGPVVSPFGMRWGRMHTGIDIAVGYGTPIHAAASGSVIYSGWMGGYGNLVVVDHGNGLATAYAHQSSIAAGNGTSVSQGEVIGYVGCTGHCFGPHLHFEVRVNGQPVDPLGYL
jgi:murein DD-endopeptidase MepM/ murein hydrolase activator NlpD